ncbi:MAG: response regulator transcription factor [Actinobacteria bacterium]|nr:MAG: response regulator transcription factor [Actinomycetota bacterium]
MVRAEPSPRVLLRRAPAAASVTSAGDERLRVLVVVEDDPDFRLLVRTLLASEPQLQIEGQAASAEEAIELARDLEPSVILLDHALEGALTGLEAAPMLKAAAPSAKIVLVTAYDLARQAEREPAVDAMVRKDHYTDLLPVVQGLLDL